MYGGAFCRIYNEFGWNVYPEVFGERLIRWLAARGAAPRTALDLGCGTGILCRVLAENGIRAEGVDLSEGMIAIARENVPGARFETADMVTYRPGSACDLVTCTGDALNHLSSLAEVERLFHNVSTYLNPGGIFVFVLLSDREIPDSEPFELDYSDTIRAVFLTERDGAQVHLHIDVYENGELRVREDIREYLHDVDAVAALLRAAGLRLIQRSHRLLPEEGADAATWFLAAERSEGKTE